MSDFDTSALPSGTLGWTAFLGAIENGTIPDESEWLEFKANLDLTKKSERPVLAKAIVAFANRDADLAARHMDGRGIVVVGLETANLVGVQVMDPAELHDAIQPYLANPAPRWDYEYRHYKGTHVLVVTIEPPKPGDPIHCIAKNGDQVKDGDIYVRGRGRSAPATSADLGQLSARLLAANSQGPQLEVSVHEDDRVPVFDYPDDWVDRWLAKERRRLLAPLEPPAPSKRDELLNRVGIDLLDGGQSPRIADLLANVGPPPSFASLTSLNTGRYEHHEEDRTEDEYREEVDAYLNRCEAGLPRAVRTLRKELSPAVRFQIRNLSQRNYAALVVHVHVEGDIRAYDHTPRFSNLKTYAPKPPRIWGPWKTDLLQRMAPNLPERLHPVQSYNAAASPVTRSTDIVNGGSADLTFPPIDLRPGATVELDSLTLVAGPDIGDQINCTWDATAADADGTAHGQLAIALGEEPVDLGDYLEHGSDQRPSTGRITSWLNDELNDD
ncbi:ATP-binding protein [Nocardioides sp. LHD-245]|uniref:AlbA family DNA-binding domain-containing protein n=1 Tax=Nocardioides sp. LHD-245 TaxID=3051387 RepID=UPI0027DF61FF|nr:ATP-binding protein [Nocardioides sp. LHD-245]